MQSPGIRCAHVEVAVFLEFMVRRLLRWVTHKLHPACDIMLQTLREANVQAEGILL